MSTLDTVRSRAWRLLDRPGRLGEAARKMNAALGRPLASDEELADRRAFAEGYGKPDAAIVAEAPAVAKDAAPVVVFTLDKQRRDAERLTQMLDDAEVVYTVRSLEGDPAGLAAVRRDSKGHRLPVVFVAGEAVGGRAQLINLGRAGIRKLVLG